MKLDNSVVLLLFNVVSSWRLIFSGGVHWGCGVQVVRVGAGWEGQRKVDSGMCGRSGQ